MFRSHGKAICGGPTLRRDGGERKNDEYERDPEKGRCMKVPRGDWLY
jgi:hypothetical protein